MRSAKSLAVIVVSLAALSAGACGETAGPGDSPDAGTSKDRDAGTSTGDDGGWLVWDAGTDPNPGRDAGLDPDAACVATSAAATVRVKPVDIVFVVDNSASMGDEIIAVQNNINVNFANIIAASGIDYRVILVAKHGAADPDESICIEAPLSTTSCNPVPGEPGTNPPIFFHYSEEIASHNSVCRLMDTYSVTDIYGLAAGGWRSWLRSDALKVFVELSDDGLACTNDRSERFDDLDSTTSGETAAAAFDRALTALDPTQFGSPAARNYVWHSIINLAAKSASEAYQPSEPIQTETCATSGQEGPGTGYQALSRLTGGLRFPICERASYDAVFREIATGVIEGAVVDCEYPIPEPPPGKTIDLKTVVIGYTPGSGGQQQLFHQVADRSQCVADRFFIEDGILKLCPDTCSRVQADDGAQIVVLYGCKVELS